MKSVTVKMSNGILRGATLHGCDGIEYCAFKGVPYAKPPLGDLRFKDPEPVENWDGERDATKFGNSSAQYHYYYHAYDGSEDCLYLNVYVKSIQDVNTLKPVMFFIHGGFFLHGSGDDQQFGADYFMRKDIILITVNYRLGVLGFLNLEDEVAPGNQGLRDLIMALQWVQDNIKNFGGDPSNVTIFGESAGAYAVQCLIFSPLAKGLFHKAASHSCTAFNTWARVTKPKQFAIALCFFLKNYKVSDNKSILEFLKTIPCRQLIMAQEHLKKTHEKFQAPAMVFGPGTDLKSTSPVVPIPLEDAALNGIHIPYLLGHNDREGIFCIIDSSTFKELSPEAYTYMDRNFDRGVHEAVQERQRKCYNLSSASIKNIYYSDGKVSIQNREELVNMTTDWYFVEGVHKSAQIQAEKGLNNTYFYKFTYCDEISSSKSLITTPIAGACHFDELEYLFTMVARKSLKPGTSGHKLMKQMVEMWTNFAAYGSPTPKVSELIPVEWLPIDTDTKNIRYLNIGTELRMETMPNFVEKFSKMKQN